MLKFVQGEWSTSPGIRRVQKQVQDEKRQTTTEKGAKRGKQEKKKDTGEKGTKGTKNNKRKEKGT